MRLISTSSGRLLGELKKQLQLSESPGGALEEF
jgi:hypothetical protein